MIAATLAALLLVSSTGSPKTPAWGGHLTKGDERNPAVMPPQRITLKFNHQVHLQQADLDCTACHQDVAKSDKAKDYNIPPKSICQDCHDDAEIGGDWSAKWKDPANAVALPPANLKFPHDKHVGREGVTCLTCHAGVDTTAVATRDHLPSMETCLTCHDGAKAPNACTTCHVAGAGSTLATAFGSGVLKPDDHGVHWIKEHELQGERDLAYCASCHEQQDCFSCHEGSIPPSFHDNDYLAIHRQDAVQNNPPCASCHDLDTFCANCHFRAERRLGRPIFSSFDGAFHPAGWNDFPPLRQQHHSFVAKKNLASCTGCHAQEDCVGCHAWYQGAPKTHPAGWANSSFMRRLLRDNPATCQRCHDPTNPDDPITQLP